MLGSYEISSVSLRNPETPTSIDLCAVYYSTQIDEMPMNGKKT